MSYSPSFSFAPHKNFAYSTAGNSPGLSSTYLAPQEEDYSKFPATYPFNVVVCPPGVVPTVENAEIMTVTGAYQGNAWTVTRHQEGTTAKDVEASWQIFNAVTVGVLGTIESACLALDLAIYNTNIRIDELPIGGDPDLSNVAALTMAENGVLALSTGAIISLIAGTKDTPPITFTVDTSTGIYQSAVGKLSFSAVGTKVLEIDNTNDVPVVTIAGTLSFETAPNFGLRLKNTNNPAILTGEIGALLYNTETETVQFYDGSAWVSLATPVTSPSYTAARAIVTSAEGVLTTSAVTSTELAYVSGVTSSIQTQIGAINSTLAAINVDGKANLSGATFTGLVTVPSFNISGATASRVPVFDASKDLTDSSVTSTELGYLSGVTGAIQTQLGTKAPIDNPTFTTKVTTPALNISGVTADRLATFDSSKNLVSSTATISDINNISGSTGNIQAQINTIDSDMDALTSLVDGTAPLNNPTFTTGITSPRIVSTGPVLIPSGDVSNPSLRFSAGETTGLYYTSGNLQFAVGGASIGRFTASGLTTSGITGTSLNISGSSTVAAIQITSFTTADGKLRYKDGYLQVYDEGYAASDFTKPWCAIICNNGVLSTSVPIDN